MIMENLKALAYELRETVMDEIMAGKAGHIGGDMSVMEILTELYFRQMNISPENADDPNRDKFVRDILWKLITRFWRRKASLTGRSW